MTKEQLKEDLKDVKELYFVPTNSNFTRFNVYYLKNGGLALVWIDVEEKDTPNYWVPLHYTRSGNYIGGYFQVNAYGTNRIFEVTYSLGQWLFGDGYKFKGVPLA